MKKSILLAVSCAGLFAFSANAQSEAQVSDFVENTPARKVAFEPHQRWFITLQGGVNYGWAKSMKTFPFVESLRPSAGVGLGFQFNPYLATRVMVDWHQLMNPNYAKTNTADVAKITNPKDFKSVNFYNPHLDFLFDVTNYFAPYKEDRVFHFVPFVGVGLGINQDLYVPTPASAKGDFHYSVTGNAGINFDFNISPMFAFSIAPTVTVANVYENAEGNYSNLVLPQLRAALTFGLNKGAFEGVEPMDYALLNTLQSQINDLKAQNVELSKRPVSCPDCSEFVDNTPKVVKTIESVVYFRIGSSKIDKNQLLSIYNVAEFVKANNTPITVTGYADAKTGKSNYNLKLSEKRARQVADKLIEEYGVPSNLITIEYKGDAEQPYANNAWNRVVIMKN